ncbi:MAG: PAS-domain containing protein [Ramlibacter sp.]
MRSALPDAVRQWGEQMDLHGTLLDAAGLGMYALDLQDRAVAWNCTFLRMFPEHDGPLHVGEHYGENLRRFYAGRLDASELPNIERYVAAGIERHRTQTQPFDFVHRGQRLQASTQMFPGLGRVRLWRPLEPLAPQDAGGADIAASQLGDVLEGMPDALVVCEPDGLIRWANASFATLLGAASARDVLGATVETVYARAWADAPASDDASRRRGASVLRANLGLSGAPFELPLPGHRHCRVIARPAHNGVLVYALIDISALKQSQAALQVTLDYAGRGILRTDAEGRVVLYNRRLLEVLELPPALLAGEPPIADFIRFQQQRGDFDAGALPDAATGPALVEQLAGSPHYLRRTTSGRVLEVATQKLPDGGMVRTFSDVTDYVLAQEALSDKTRALQLTLDNMSQGISAVDARGRVTMSNRRYQELLGLPESLMATQPTMEQLVRFQIDRGDFGPDFEFVDAVARGYVAVGDKVAALQSPETYKRKTHDGRVLEVHTRPLPDGGAVRTFTDISAYIRSQEALIEAKEAAQQANQAKSRFLSNMSHEIRTPMNAVLGMLKLLRTTSLSQRQADYAAKAESAAQSLLSLLNDVLDFSKIEAGKMRLDRRPFSLEVMLADLSVILSSGAAKRDLEVLYDLDPRVPDALVGDDMRLRQILINLGGNAVKFTERGEVVIGTRLLAHDGRQATIEFRVQDTGIGISPEQQGRLVGDFVQATDQTARHFGGTGLGLGICRRLTELMGSSLQLESTPGVGSRFWFVLTLPVGALARHAPPAPVVERVLLVDDNAVARAALAGLARANGWQADTAADGEAALARIDAARAAARPYDAVFVDGPSRGLDDWQDGLRIRAHTAGRRVPLLLTVTAHGRQVLDQRPAEEQALFDGVLVKPLTPGMLRDALARTAEAAPPSEPRASASPLAGLRLLLAEDNPVNQQIASELLSAQGARVDVVDDGLAAIEALAPGHRYDAVLMDVLMPRLDGLGATRRIRNVLGEHLPVIANTANAMDSDRAECLAAGMDDHVGKPIVLDEVVRAVLRQIGRRAGQRPAQATDGPAGPAAAAQQLPPPLLDRDGAIERLGGNTGLFERLLPAFRTNLEQARRDIGLALDQSARDDLCRLMHTIKGMAGTMGAAALAAAAARAEAGLCGGDAPLDGPATGQVTSLIAQTLQAL